MKNKIINLCLITAFVTLGLLLTLPFNAMTQGTEDIAETQGDSPSLVTVEIPSMTVPNVIMDFDLMPAGATSLVAITTAFPGSMLSGLTFSTRAGTGTYDFQTGGGRALTANSDGSGNLVLIDPPADIFGEADALTIDLSGNSTEIGFEIGDWSGPFNVELYDGAVQVGLIQVDTSSDNRSHVVQSDVPFNRVVLTALPDEPGANWVVAELVIEDAPAPVPAVTEWGMIVFLVFAGLGSVYYLRRKKIEA